MNGKNNNDHKMKNKVVIRVGRPCRNSVQPWVHEIKIQVWNSVDDIHSFGKYNMENTDGYISGEQLDRLLFCMGLLVGSSYKGRPGFDVHVEMI